MKEELQIDPQRHYMFKVLDTEYKVFVCLFYKEKEKLKKRNKLFINYNNWHNQKEFLEVKNNVLNLKLSG